MSRVEDSPRVRELTCPHVFRTLIATSGFGTWQPVETYECDACGQRLDVPVLIEDSSDD